MKLNKLKDYESCIKTLKEISYDSQHDEYMTQSDILSYDFDNVKTKYLNDIKLSEEACKSVDGLLIRDNKRYFIEFKNGEKVKPQDIRLKIKASLLILCDISKQHISNVRETDEFILVYNEERNPSKENPKEKISEYFLKKGGDEFIRYGLERYKNLYFKEVHTFTKKEFEEFLKSKTPK